MAFLKKWFLDPKWRTIYRLGNVKILAASFASFVFIYVTARVVGQVQLWLHTLGTDVLKGDRPTSDWLISVSAGITMPLGLKLVAYSAIFAVIAKGIYEARCPPYIKQGDSIEHFRNAYSEAISILADDFRRLWNSSSTDRRGAIRANIRTSHLINLYFMAGSQQNEDTDDLNHDTVVRFHYDTPHPGGGTFRTARLIHALRDRDLSIAILDILREFRDDCNRFSRFLCALSYYVAILFAAAALLYQASWVLPLLMS
jgi:hypothetical protein